MSLKLVFILTMYLMVLTITQTHRKLAGGAIIMINRTHLYGLTTFCADGCREIPQNYNL